MGCIASFQTAGATTCRRGAEFATRKLWSACRLHIVARIRDYCFAGTMTFIGLALGISVMLFSFGPAVFFLYAERWRPDSLTSEGGFCYHWCSAGRKAPLAWNHWPALARNPVGLVPAYVKICRQSVLNSARC